MRHDVVDEKTLITTTLISSCHWKTLTFRFRKKRPENVFYSELSQNHTGKQIMPFKTTLNWIFNGI